VLMQAGTTRSFAAQCGIASFESRSLITILPSFINHVHSKRGKYHNRYGDRRPTHTTHIHHVAMYMCVDEEG
jgi:hypothetical protein